jgi:hypothetical protein
MVDSLERQRLRYLAEYLASEYGAEWIGELTPQRRLRLALDFELLLDAVMKLTEPNGAEPKAERQARKGRVKHAEP